jgi:hypothetical protein
MSLESLDAPLPELFDRIIGTHASFVNDTPSFALVEADPSPLRRLLGQEELDEAIIDRGAPLPGAAPAAHERRAAHAATRLSVVAVGVTCERSGRSSPAARARSCCASCDMLVRY